MSNRRIPGTEPMPVHSGSVDPLGQVIGDRWRLQRVIGRGGTATVYEAHSTASEVAAVKLLDAPLAEHPQARERFRREAVAAQRIKHPDVVRILDHGDDPLGPYIAMELLDGRPLDYWISRGQIPIDKLLKVLIRVLDVLAVAHDHGIIHRDVKPSNVFLTRSGGVKVLDFGIARMLEALPDDLRTKTGMAVGTLTYMAPEQARGLPSQIDARSDLFSVAATAFRIVAGRPVHSRSKPGELLLAMATQVAPRLQSVAPHVPPELCRVIDVGLAYAKDHRYPDARTMRADLQAVRHGRPPPFAGSQLDSHRGETGTVPDYPFEPTPSDEAPETDETLHLGTPESVPPAIDSSPGSALPSEEVPSEHTTVPFAGVPERSALDATNSGTTDEYRSSRSTQPMGSFSGSDEKE